MVQNPPKLFTDRPAGSLIRIWSTGCSTGEEAYSLAILLAEQQELLRQNYKVQVFATDIDSQSVAFAGQNNDGACEQKRWGMRLLTVSIE